MEEQCRRWRRYYGLQSCNTTSHTGRKREAGTGTGTVCVRSPKLHACIRVQRQEEERGVRGGHRLSDMAGVAIAQAVSSMPTSARR